MVPGIGPAGFAGCGVGRCASWFIVVYSLDYPDGPTWLIALERQPETPPTHRDDDLLLHMLLSFVVIYIEWMFKYLHGCGSKPVRMLSHWDLVV